MLDRALLTFYCTSIVTASIDWRTGLAWPFMARDDDLHCLPFSRVVLYPSPRNEIYLVFPICMSIMPRENELDL